MSDMAQRTRSMADVLESFAAASDAGERPLPQVYPTGFTPLDEHLGGGLRGGELLLLGGAQGLGKTTLCLQLARNVAAGGGSALYVSYEHDDVSLLARLLVQEAFLSAGPSAHPLANLLPALEAVAEPGTSFTASLAHAPGLAAASEALSAYGPRFVVHAASGRTTDVEEIRETVLASVREGRKPLVVVDYLQKVLVKSEHDEAERVTRVVEGLKDLALEAGVPVVAIVAATTEGIAPGSRLRAHQLRGSSALAYEADVILLLNEKYDIVARRHITYDPRGAERYRQVAVCSIEKNRSGRSHIDMEFRKEFEYCRYDPYGNLVEEQLVDERIDAT